MPCRMAVLDAADGRLPGADPFRRKAGLLQHDLRMLADDDIIIHDQRE